MATNKTEYSKLLLTKQWKSKRVEILCRDGYKCTKCSRGKPILHVHHKYYVLNVMPWEYPNNALITLCNICHKKEHLTNKLIFLKSFPPIQANIKSKLPKKKQGTISKKQKINNKIEKMYNALTKKEKELSIRHLKHKK